MNKDQRPSLVDSNMYLIIFIWRGFFFSTTKSARVHSCWLKLEGQIKNQLKKKTTRFVMYFWINFWWSPFTFSCERRNDGCRSRIVIAVVDWCERHVEELVEKCFSYLIKRKFLTSTYPSYVLYSVHIQINPFNTDIRRLHCAISYINMMSPPNFLKAKSCIK
jgi:tryptophan-rich sensory protein